MSKSGQPSLNYVLRWNEDHFETINAPRAEELFGGIGVSARRHVFFCGHCMQPVTFVRGEKIASHFRHSSDEADKSCEDRVTASTAYSPAPNETPLPLKLIIPRPNETLRFQLGFLTPRQATPSKKALGRVRIRDEHDRELNVYEYDRLAEPGIHFLKAGNRLVAEYRIETEGYCPGAERWSRVVPVCRVNSILLFHGESHKRLPVDADVSTHTTYLLLTDKPVAFPSRIVTYCEISHRDDHRWHLYSFHVDVFNEAAAKFFATLKVRLTQTPVQMFPLWPMTTKTPYTITHEGRRLIFCVSGNDIVTGLYPRDGAQCRRSPGNTYLSELHTKSLGVFLSAGRSTILKYAFLDEGLLVRQAPELDDSTVTITDINGRILTEDQLSERLPQNLIYLSSELNAVAEIRVNGQLVERFNVLGEDEPCSKTLPWRSVLAIRIGLETIRLFDYGSSAEVSTQTEMPQSVARRGPQTRQIPLTVSKLLLNANPESGSHTLKAHLRRSQSSALFANRLQKELLK